MLLKRGPKKHFLDRVIAALLCISILAPTFHLTPASAWGLLADDFQTESKNTDKDADQNSAPKPDPLLDKIQDTLFKFKYRGTLSAGKVQSPGEMLEATRDLEQELAKERLQIEKALLESSNLDDDFKSVSSYFIKRIMLVQVCAALPKPQSDQACKDGTELKLPFSTFGELSGFTHLSEFERTGFAQKVILNSNSLLIVDPASLNGDENSSERVTIKLNPAQVDLARTKVIAAQPSQQMYLLAWKFMTARWLLETDAEIDLYKSQKRAQSSQAPQSLIQEVSTLGNILNTIQEKHAIQNEALFRKALTQTLPKGPWNFADQPLLQRLFEITAPDSEIPAEFYSAQLQVLFDLESKTFSENATRLIADWPIPLSTSSVVAQRQLRNLLGQALVASTATLLKSYNKDSRTSEQDKAVIQAIENHKTQYINAISASIISQWHDDARVWMSRAKLNEVRKPWLQKLIHQSAMLRRAESGRSYQVSADFQSILEGLQYQVANLHLSTEGRMAWEQLQSAENFMKAQNILTQEVAKRLAELTNRDQALSVISKAAPGALVLDFAKIRALLVPYKNVADSKFLIGDIESLLQIGTWAGLDRPDISQQSEISLARLPLSSFQRNSIKTAVVESQIKNPLLKTELPGQKAKLHTVLADIAEKNPSFHFAVSSNPKWVSDHEIQEATPYVDQALGILQKNIESDLNLIAPIRDFDQLSYALSTSKVINTGLRMIFPALGGFQEELVDRMLDTSPFEKAWHRWTGGLGKPFGYLMPLFILHSLEIFAGKGPVGRGIRWATSFGKDFTSWFNVFAPYFIGSMVVDTGLDVKHVLSKRSDLKLFDQFYSIGLRDEPIYNASDRTTVQGAYNAQKAKALSSFGMNLFMMGMPIISMNGKRMIQSFQDMRRSKLFAEIGMSDAQMTELFERQVLESTRNKSNPEPAVWSEAQIRKSAKDRAARTVEELKLTGPRKFDVELRLNEKAEEIISTLREESQKAQSWLEDYGPEFDTLRIPKNSRSFNLNIVQEALSNIELDASANRVGASQLKKAKKAAATIQQFVLNEMAFLQPGLLSRIAMGRARAANGTSTLLRQASILGLNRISDFWDIQSIQRATEIRLEQYSKSPRRRQVILKASERVTSNLKQRHEELRRLLLKIDPQFAGMDLTQMGPQQIEQEVNNVVTKVYLWVSEGTATSKDLQDTLEASKNAIRYINDFNFQLTPAPPRIVRKSLYAEIYGFMLPDEPKAESKMPRPEDYKILAVTKETPMDEVTLAYRRKAKAYHPDRAGAVSENTLASNAFREVVEAYKRIKNYHDLRAQCGLDDGGEL